MNRSAVAALLLLSLLAGCGGGGDATAVPAPNPLATTDAVAGYLVPGPIIALVPASALAAKAGVAPDALTRAKAVQACANGGTRDLSAPYARDMDSPFSAESFMAQDSVTVQCRTDHPQGFTIVDGPATTGCPASHMVDGQPCPPRTDRILSSILGTAQAPLRVRIRTAVEGGTGDFEDVYPGAIFHERTNGTQLDAAELNAPFTRSLSVNGGPVVRYTARYGTATMPLQQVTVAIGNSQTDSEIEGAIAFDATGCSLGEFQVGTLTPVRLDYSSGQGRFVGGLLRIDQAGRSARVQFNADQTLTLTDAAGRSESYTVDQLIEAAGACAGYMF
jgi:hypothetical protein